MVLLWVLRHGLAAGAALMKNPLGHGFVACIPLLMCAMLPVCLPPCPLPLCLQLGRGGTAANYETDIVPPSMRKTIAGEEQGCSLLALRCSGGHSPAAPAASACPHTAYSRCPAAPETQLSLRCTPPLHLSVPPHPPHALPALPALPAVYEAARALVGYITPHFDEIQRVSVCPGGVATGYTYFLPMVSGGYWGAWSVVGAAHAGPPLAIVRLFLYVHLHWT